MPATATKRRNLPRTGTYWTNDKELWFIQYAHEEDDVIYLEDCRTGNVAQIRRFEWHRIALREVKR